MQRQRSDKISFLTRLLTNPFAAYAMAFGAAIAIYSLGWSDLYPPLQTSLQLFLAATSILSLFLAYAIAKPVSVTGGSIELETFKSNVFIFLCIMGAFLIEVLGSGGLPLLSIVSGGSLSYSDFGIPTLHVAFFGFCFFYSVYWFDLYILGSGKKYLLLSLSCFSTSLLMLSRGAFISTSIALAVVYVRRRGFDRGLVLTFAAILGLIVWGFGLLGEIRSNGPSGESVILAIGRPSDKFTESKVPTELLWAYLYSSSPLANLQLNVTDRTTTDEPLLYFMLELFPDFVSKRLVSEEVTLNSAPLLNTDELNVSTMYGRSFRLLGWLGLCLTFTYFVVFSIICLAVLNRSKYFTASIAILFSMSFLDIFDNMFISSTGVTPLLVALLLNIFERKTNSAQSDSCRVESTAIRP